MRFQYLVRTVLYVGDSELGAKRQRDMLKRRFHEETTINKVPGVKKKVPAILYGT